MLLSTLQTPRFWREWKRACRVHGWTDEKGWTQAQIDAERHALLLRAGFTSLTLVDPRAGFDRVLAELAALHSPADIAPQLRAQAQPRTRLLYSIGHAGAAPYVIAAIARADFGTDDLDQLTEEQLRRLAIHLAHRSRKRKRETQPF